MAAEAPPITLPAVAVFSPRVANQVPTATFAMPVTLLRFEPRVDIHGRNLAEAQADVTIRGGIFESTGFRVGGSTVLDPQTGHYFAELPIAPEMLGTPEIQTGVASAQSALNATSGTLSYGWRPVRTGGSLAAGAGEYATVRGSVHVAQERNTRALGEDGRLGVDFAIARSESDGPLAWGDSRFDRLNGRLQLKGARFQTDLFAGYQAKFFGWLNLYTPFNSPETENLQTVLVMANHHADLGGGDRVQFSAYHRRNKDDYAFNRLAPVGVVHPFQHTTHVLGVSAEGKNSFGDAALGWRVERLADRIASTSLTFGPYRDRVLSKLALVPEIKAGAAMVRAGLTYDHGSRDGGIWSPQCEVSSDVRGVRWHASYARTSQVPTYTALKSSPSGGLFRGNQTLGRAISHQIETGARGVAGEWTLEAAAFARRDDGLVDWTFRRGVTARTANAVDIDTLGLEAVARRGWRHGELVVGYTGLSKAPDYRGAAVDASFYALNYARHRVTAALTWRLGGGFEMRLDNVARVQADNLLRVSGGRRVLNSSIGVSCRPSAWRGAAVTLQAENLWNSRFQEVPAVPAPGRQMSAGVSYTW